MLSQLAGALLPKSQRKEVFFYAPKQKGKHNKENEKKKEKSKMLKYDVGTLAYFEQCGVSTTRWTHRGVVRSSHS